MADLFVGLIVLVVFFALLYNLFFQKKKKDCHTLPSCAGCSESRDCVKPCDHCSPEELKNELQKILHDK